MGLIGRYVVRTTMGAFLMVLMSLTGVVWVTQALREIDLVTTQGQTVLAFVGITFLVIPNLIVIVAPLAFVVAIGFTLNKLNTDSEIVVMNASGMSPWRIFLPFFTVAAIVSVAVTLLNAYIAPKSLRELRTQLTKIRADLVANVIHPGRFTSLDGERLTFHVRERRANGQLGGIFIDDRRNPQERGTFLAEHGRVVENESGTFLVLEHGSVQRLEAKERDPAIVLFDRYAFDLTVLTGSGELPTFGVKERYLWELIWPDYNDPYIKANPTRVWPELNERLSGPIYPLVFAVIAFAILGAPRTSRQSRGISIGFAIAAVSAVRLVGFAAIVFSAKTPSAVIGLYVMLGLVLAAGLTVISRGAILEPPALLMSMINALQARLARLFAPAPGGAAA